MTVEQVTFINTRGQSIELSNRRPFLLQSVEGKGDVGADIQTQKAPYQDGASYADSLLQVRSIALNLSVRSSTPEELEGLKQLLTTVFNPKLGPGKLIYSKGATTREIKATVENIIQPVGKENHGLRFQRAVINLLCPSVFFEDIHSENYKLEDFVGNFRFKFHFPVRFATRGDSKILLNKGDVPTPIVVEFRGAAVNPKITNVTTGEFIRVNRTIPPGYKLVLETTFGNKRVEIIAPDGVVENGFPWIDPESTFFNLDVGETKFSFITEGGNPEVYVEYKHRYLSV